MKVQGDKHADGPPTELAMKKKLKARGYSVSKYVYPPGTYFPPHTHDCDKINGVLSGRFKLTLDGESVILKPADCIEVPAGVLHSAEVVGPEPVVGLNATK